MQECFANIKSASKCAEFFFSYRIVLCYHYNKCICYCNFWLENLIEFDDAVIFLDVVLDTFLHNFHCVAFKNIFD